MFCDDVLYEQLLLVVVDMAERPEDLNLPNSVVSKIIKEAVCNACSSTIFIGYIIMMMMTNVCCNVYMEN